MPNAYIEFVKKNRASVAKKHPNAKPTEVMKLVAAAYRSKAGKGKMKGRGKSLEAILKDDAFPVPVADLNNMVGKIAPDGKSKWYKNDTPGEYPGTYAADPGKSLMDNVNNLFYKDGAIWINKRFNTPFTKPFSPFSPLGNYKNPGKLGFFEAIPEALFNLDNYRVAKQYWDKIVAPIAGVVLNPIASVIGKKAGDALNTAFNNDLDEFFSEEKKAGSGVRKIKRIPKH